jgi:hypothetical protein
VSAHRHEYIETEARAREILANNPPRQRIAESVGIVLMAQRRLLPVTTAAERQAAQDYNAQRARGRGA